MVEDEDAIFDPEKHLRGANRSKYGEEEYWLFNGGKKDFFLVICSMWIKVGYMWSMQHRECE